MSSGSTYTVPTADCDLSMDKKGNIVLFDENGSALVQTRIDFRVIRGEKLAQHELKRMLLDAFRSGYSSGHRCGDSDRLREIKSAMGLAA